MMNRVMKAGLLLCAIVLAGCSNPGRFGGVDDTVDLNAAAPVSAAVDRNTPSYFSQAIGDRVLFAVDGYRYGGKDFDRRDTVRELVASLPTIEAVAKASSLSSLPRTPTREYSGKPWSHLHVLA